MEHLAKDAVLYSPQISCLSKNGNSPALTGYLILENLEISRPLLLEGSLVWTIF